MLNKTPLAYLYWLTLAWGVAIFWIAPHTPLTDLPQHAGQIALLNDLLFGQPTWGELFNINLLTPYLSTYAVATALSQAMSIANAFKLLLSIGYLAFVCTCIQLRKHFKVSPRLDWLFVLPFFGFAYQYGFLSFVLSAPIGLWFILVADQYAENTTKSIAIKLTAIGLLLLMSHGLMFLFALGVGAAFLLIKNYAVATSLKMKSLALKILPYVILTLAFGFIFMANAHTNKALGLAEYSIEASQNGLKNLELIRIPQAFFYTLAGSKISIYPLVHIPVMVILLAAPWLFGLRIQVRNLPANLFFIAIATLFALVPGYIFGTYFVYQRFSIFIIPSYALLFTLQTKHANSTLIPNITLALLIAACWSTLALNTVRAFSFKKEAAGFEQLITQLKPGQKALALILDPISKADNNSIAYTHYPLWYQAEKNGVVYDNFAIYAPMPVRFKPGHVHLGYEHADANTFEWLKHQGGLYTYFFVRTAADGEIPQSWFKNAPCQPKLIARDGQWRIYQNQVCKK